MNDLGALEFQDLMPWRGGSDIDAMARLRARLAALGRNLGRLVRRRPAFAAWLVLFAGVSLTLTLAGGQAGLSLRAWLMIYLAAAGACAVCVRLIVLGPQT